MTPPDQYDKQAEEMAKQFVDNVSRESDALGGFDTICTVEQTLLSTIPLASLLRDKARLDWLEENTPGQSYLNGWRVQAGDEESNYGFVRCVSHKGNQDVRQAIDAAIKEKNDK